MTEAPPHPPLWVICRDYGTEGLSAPFQAFYDEKQARQAMLMLDKLTTGGFKLFPVPVWE